ncbi:MAG: hypothetical protein JNK38_15245 [Acidobacteria bacterium]|nr:hypothetical protein [Acidobacteriota bacterium]
MKFAKTILFAAILSVGFLSQSAHAQSCQALLTDLINHASKQDGNDNYIAFQMTGNRETADWAQYTTGTLRYTPARFFGNFLLPPRFGGEAEQSFSDRIWTEPPPQGGLFGVQHPFSPYAKDKLRVSFNISPFIFNGNYGDLTYTLLSWGNASATVTPQCQGNYMYAYLNDQMLTFSFRKVSAAIPH